MSYPSEVLADSPLAYYRLGESSGTAMVDASGNGRDGTYTSTALGTAGALAGSGDSDTAITLTGGTGNAGAVPYDTWMNGLTAVTVEAWVNTTATSGTRFVVARTGNTNYNYGLAVINGKAFMGLRTTSTSLGATGTTNVADGLWHHLVGTWDGTTLRIYVDGVLDGTASLSGTMTTAANGLQVGGRGANYFVGSIDEAAVYSSALSASRIAAHYGAGTSSAPAVTAALTGTGALTASVVPVRIAAAALTGTGGLAASVVPVGVAAAVLAGTGGFAAAAVAVAQSSALLDGAGTLTADVEVPGEAPDLAGDLAGEGALTATITAVAAVDALLPGSGAPTATVAPVAATDAAYADQVLADEPWGYWRLGEDGTEATTEPYTVRMRDSSGNRHHGSLSTISARFSLPGALPADPDTGIGRANGAVPTSIDPGWAPLDVFTAEGFFDTTPPALPGDTYRNIVALSVFPVTTFAVAYSPGFDRVEFRTRAAGGTTVIVAATPATVGVHHFAATYDGAEMRLYLDGELVGTAAQSGPLAQATRIYVGSTAGAQGDLYGLIDEVALYRTALTAEQIAQHHDAIDTPAPAWRYADLSGATTLTAALELVPGIAARLTGTGVFRATAVPVAISIPMTPAAPNAGRARTGTGVATWEPPVVTPPATVTPVHARVAAHAYTSVTMAGTRPQFDGLRTAERSRHRDRIVIAGRDVTYWRGIATPLPRFGLVSPLLYGSGTLELPQVAACFESPGHGALSWLRPGATVLVQRVAVDGPNAGKVIATDYRGIVMDFGISGRALTVDLGGDALGRASLRDKQVPIFRRRNDLGWWWWNALAGPEGLGRPFGKVGGPTTAIRFYDTGGTRFADYLNDLAAKGTNLGGTQWTCTPIESGPSAGTYRVHRKDTETVTGTVYLDDAHTVADLHYDVSEQPNRVYGTGVTPKGERAKFGVYPVLAEDQRARFPNYLTGQPMQLGDTNADTDSGGGVTALLHRLSVTGYLSAEDFAGGYDSDVVRAVRDLQDDAGLPETGKVDGDTWGALFDVNVVGYSTRGSRVEPIAQANRVRRVRRNASGQVVGRNPGYDRNALVVDLTNDYGTGITRAQMRSWARARLTDETPGSNPSGNGRHWTGTLRFELGALIAGVHTPGDQLGPSDLMHARALRPGHNLWLPHFDGGTLLHVSGVDVNSDHQVTATVDTRARDTMTVWEVIARNQDNKRNPARAWIRDHRSSSFVKDAVTEFDEIGGTITDRELVAGWNVFPVVAGQEGTIARVRLRLDKPAEFVTAVFGRRIGPRRLAQVIGNPLEHAGARRWSDPDRLDRLVGDHVLLYVAGDDQAPCGYYPGTKEARTYTPQVPNPAYNVDVPASSPSYDDRETLPEQVPNPAYNPDDPDGDQEEFIDRVVTEQLTPQTGQWNDDAGFGYRTFDQSCVLWVAVYVRRPRTLLGGRIMWPQLEAGA